MNRYQINRRSAARKPPGLRFSVGAVLDKYLPEDTYDKDLFTQKRDKVFELTLDLAINHQRWAA